MRSPDLKRSWSGARQIWAVRSQLVEGRPERLPWQAVAADRSFFQRRKKKDDASRSSAQTEEKAMLIYGSPL